MQNLYWVHRGRRLRAVEEVKFKSEDELERYVIQEGKDALADIFILKRQVRAAGDIPDIVAVDRDNNVVIIENKNTDVDEEIVPQILRYAIWAEKNPDSIKAMWLEAKDRPEDWELDFDKLGVRIIILAPHIKPSVAHFVAKLGYAVELIEVKKFVAGREEFILKHTLESESPEKRRTAKGMETYNRDYYLARRNPKSVELFLTLADELERMVKKKGWPLERKFNQSYVGFKRDIRVAFGVYWVGSKSIGVFLKVPKDRMRAMRRMIPYEIGYRERWKELTVKVDEKFALRRVSRALEACYRDFVGK
jgi:hypothetical protein